MRSVPSPILFVQSVPSPILFVQSVPSPILFVQSVPSPILVVQSVPSLFLFVPSVPVPSPILFVQSVPSPILFVRRAFGKTRQWEELAGLAKSKKSAIGFGPFVDVCIEAGVPAEANRYTEQCFGVDTDPRIHASD